jgi:hypothetical protein
MVTVPFVENVTLKQMTKPEWLSYLLLNTERERLRQAQTPGFFSIDTDASKILSHFADEKRLGGYHPRIISGPPRRPTF